jgi:hypothetical protein
VYLGVGVHLNGALPKSPHRSLRMCILSIVARKRIVGRACLWVSLCMPLSLLGNNSVKTYPRQRIIAGVVLYSILVISKERKQLVLPCYPRVKAGSNTSTTAQRVVGGHEKEPSAWRYNWPTLFLRDINTRTWPSRLGESRIWDSKIWSWVPRYSDLRMTALARTSSNCKRQTRSLVRESAPHQQTCNWQQQKSGLGPTDRRS